MHILLNWTLQGAIVAAATAGGLRVLRGAPATTRHAVCWTALVAILGLPFVPFLWTAVWAAGSAPAAAPAAAFALPAPSAGLSAPLVRLPALFSATSVLLGAAWMLWTMLQAVRVMRDVRWLQRARRRCRALPPAIAARFSPATTRLVAETGARVVLCDAVRAAAVLGGGQPVIGLQRRLVHALSDSELNAVLVHELAHVLRRDSLATVVQRAVHVLVGWHPGVWWVMGRLALEREMACDEAALAEAGGPKAYATCLTRIAGLAQRAAIAPGLALGMLPACGLRRRVVHVLTPGRFSRRGAGWACGTLSTSLCALATAMGTVVVFGEPAKADSIAAFGTVTSRLVQPSPDVRPVSIAQEPRRTLAARVQPSVPASATVAPPVGDPPARTNDRVGAASATQESVTPAAQAAEPGPASPGSMPLASTHSAEVQGETAVPSAPLPAPAPVATPGVPRDHPVADAAVVVAAGATDVWSATSEAAAETGVAVGRKTQKGAVATAGAFGRWGRRIASSF